MEFLVKFEINIPTGASESEIQTREDAEAVAVAQLAEQGHVLRIWKVPSVNATTSVLGLYRAEDETELDGLLRALPLYEWMKVTVTRLDPHPNDPAARQPTTSVAEGSRE
jgi:muconolactone delta-isomerase